MAIFNRLILLSFLGAWFLAAAPAGAATFSELSSTPFGTFNDVEFVRHTGRFEGTTSMGDFSVPFEVVAPADSADGNGSVLFEPPHNLFGPAVRDINLGRSLVFERGFSYAAVGWGADGLNVLDPASAALEPIVIAGNAITNPGTPNRAGVLDGEIIVQFIETLKTGEFGNRVLGDPERILSTGTSQSAAILLTLLIEENTDGQGLFDLSLLLFTLWDPIFAPENGPFQALSGTFDVPEDAGKVIFLNAEGDLIVSESRRFTKAAEHPDFRVYHVAGTAHQPLFGQFGIADLLPFKANSLDWAPVVRAAFVAADEWLRFGLEAPASATLTRAAGLDPVYGFETGIARDANLNALGGVRLPQVEVGQATYVASLLEFEILPGLPGLVGLEIDLTCTPLPDGSPRFRNHGDYVSRFARQANRLVGDGFLLPADAEALKTRAAESGIGKPRHCAP